MNYTGSSCLNIYNNNPETGDKSGYNHTGTQWTYCSMTYCNSTVCAGVGGGWRRTANVDTSTGSNCPSGWRSDTRSNISFYCLVSDSQHTCSNAFFSTNGTSYQRVCGRAKGYQKGGADSFWGYHSNGLGIDNVMGYTDGLLITYGSPHNHIWSYITGLYDSMGHLYAVHVLMVGILRHFQALTIIVNQLSELDEATYYFNDPLWDRSGCITVTTPTNHGSTNSQMEQLQVTQKLKYVMFAWIYFS